MSGAGKEHYCARFGSLQDVLVVGPLADVQHESLAPIPMASSFQQVCSVNFV